MPFKKYLKTVSSVPTAPYCEDWVAEVVIEELKKIPGVTVEVDEWGNLIARLLRGEPDWPPIALMVHLDHPGFLVDGPTDKDGLIPTTFEGYVTDEFFPLAGVRLFRGPDDEGVPATVVRANERSNDINRNRKCWLKPESPINDAVLGMWDLDPLRIEDDLVFGRAIDDLAGVAITLETFRQLGNRKGPTDVIGLFTRVEESGFRGAVLFCLDENRDELLPEDACVLSVEMSSQRPHTPVGKGAVLRVGDRSMVFDPDICESIHEASQKIAGKNGHRPLVRALMDGGSCEASAMNLFGYRSAGVCLPLGNYHNMDLESKKLAEEFISLQDAEDLIAVLVELCLDHSDHTKVLESRRNQFIALAEAATGRLKKKEKGKKE